jgi:S-DNA-T family DNA segregation ATPase FtsK/SpoIIIE
MLRIKVYNEQMDNKIDWAESMLKPGTYSVVIGATRDGLIYHDFDKSKHLIIAGVPGSGKSVVMKMIIISLVLSNPNNVVFSLIDLKGGPAFARFRNTKQVKNLGVDNEQAKSILRDVKEEMDNIYKNVLVPNGYEDVSEAGIKKRHFIIVDEAADLASDKEAVELLTDIVRKGRGSGHYVIYATQYPTVQTVASQIKRNIPARLTYVLDSAIASNAVLDTNGAEELPEIPGRGIYKMVKSQIIQTPFISNKDIETLIKPHVIIQARKDGQHGQNGGQATTDRKHSIEFKKI